MLKIEWDNPRINLPTEIKLCDYPDLSIGELLIQLQNQFYHSIKSYILVN